MIRFVAAALAAFPLAVLAQGEATAVPVSTAPSEAAASASSPARHGVTMGFGAGVCGSGEVGNGGSAYRIRIGALRSPRLEFGFEGGLDVEASTTRSFYDVAATFFPWRRVLFVRGGVGLSTAARDASGAAGEARQGVNLLAGVGVALGAARGFNVTLNLETMEHWYPKAGSSASHDVGSVSGWLGLEWL